MKAFLYKHSTNEFLTLFYGFILIEIIGIIDFMSGHELSLSVLYVLPISLVTWKTNVKYGIFCSLVSALTWLFADSASGHTYSHDLIPIWNTIIRLMFFLTISALLSKLREATEKEKRLARTDNLTGAMNARFFYDMLQVENDRFTRNNRPFTMVYIDLDNFKTVNDKFGHPMGDHVLSKVVNSTRTCLRKTDTVARLGGDEFALLLPETDEESARIVCTKLQAGLLQEMQAGGWPVTFSIGVLTCKASPNSIDKIVKLADELMYSVKHGSKNAIKYATYGG